MVKRSKYLCGGAGSLAPGVWAGYSTLTTARNLPDDAGWFAKMTADPPIYAPWPLLVVCIIFLAWAFWKGDDLSNFDADVSQVTGGSNSPVQFHSGTGNNIVANQIHLGPRDLKMDQGTFERIAVNLAPKEPVTLAYPAYGRTPDLVDTLKSFLMDRGFELKWEMRGRQGYQPRPDVPLEILPNGLQFHLGVGIGGSNQAIRMDGDIPIRD